MLNRYIIKHKSSVGNSMIIGPSIHTITPDIDNYNINLDNYKIKLPKINIIKTIFKPLYIEPYNPIEKSSR
jgi:hypothetical protein